MQLVFRLPNFINDQNSNTSCVPLVAVQFILETTGTLQSKIRPIISLSIWLLLMNGVITKRFNFNQIVIYTIIYCIIIIFIIIISVKRFILII